MNNQQQLNYQPSAWLIDERKENASYSLRKGDTTIGRSTDNDIVINHDTISRQHAMIRFTGAQYLLYDRGARTPIYINGHPVSGQHELVHNDKLQLGDIILRFAVAS